MAQEDAATPLDLLTEAVQEFVNSAVDDPPALVAGAVVVWEVVAYGEDGDPFTSINYAHLGQVSLSSLVGLLRTGVLLAERDVRDDL